MKIFFDAVDHSMQNEESKMMKMKWTKVVKPGVEAASYKCTKSRGTDIKRKKLESHTSTQHETNLDGIFIDVACILFIPNNSDDLQSQCGRNEIGRVKCYQSKVKEDKLTLKIWRSAIPGGVDIYTPGGVEISCTPH